MAKIRGSKEGFPYDPSVSMPTEQKASESNRQKIAKVHDMFPITTKDNIAKILQYYDDDENQAINALYSDGGREALSNWTESGSLKNKNSKKNKKKRKGKKDPGLATSNTASFDADDSSSIHSGCNVDIDIDKSNQVTVNENGILPEVTDNSGPVDNSLSNHEHFNNNEDQPLDNEPEKEIEPLPATVSEDIPTHRASISSDFNRNSVENKSRVSPLSDSSERQDEQNIKRDKYRSINENHSRHSPRQRTSSFRRNKSSSISEDSSSQNNPQALAAPTKRGYDRCKKDLHRQTASLHRIKSQLETGFEDSEKRMKNAFAEILKLIENRQTEMELELTSRKLEAFNLLRSRQDLGLDLKRRVDRTSSLSEAEWSELRSDIKQFVTERKYDDDLGKTIWFQWPDISETIKTFGEVHPVKNVYSQRSRTGQESTPSNIEASPSSSLANEEIELATDKNDVGVIADAVEDESPGIAKEETPAFNKTQQQPSTENRGTRIYNNKSYSRFHPSRFPNNRDFFQGPIRGGGNFPPYHRNYQYHNNNNRQNTFGAHPHADYPRDRNPNRRDFKGNRGRGRGGSFPNNPRYEKFGRGGGPRHNNAEHFESSQTTPGPTSEKQNGVNDS